MKKFTLFLALLFTMSVLHSQVQFISEKIQENKHILYYQNDFNFNLKQIAGQNKLIFDYPFDESKSEQFNLPVSDIFVPIQTNSNPVVKFTIENEEQIAASPEINPTVTFDNQKIFHYEYNTSIPKYYNTKFLLINGQLINDGKSYLHLSISPFIFDPNKRNIRRILKFRLEIIYPNNITATFSFNNNLNSISESKINYNNNKFGNHILIENDSTDDWIDYNANYIKIGVAKNAIYRLRYSDLNYYFNFSSVSPKSFKLINKGKEIPIFVSGEADNSFDPNDYIEFVGERNMGGKNRDLNIFGEPYNEYIDRYSDTTIYWFTWNGENGKHVVIGDNESASPSSDTLKYYNEVIHYEINNWFDFSMADQVRREMPFWYENKTWVDNQLGVGTRNYTFAISNLYSEGTVNVFSRLQDYASNISQNAHLLAISVNNAERQDSGYINKYGQKILRGKYPVKDLNDGNNSLKIHSFTTTASLNTCAFDWYEVEYPRWVMTYNDSLIFSFPFIDLSSAIKGIKITNVLSDSIVVWKYGGSFKKYNLTRSNNEIIFFDTLTNQNKFILINKNKIQTPKFYYVKQFVNLRNSQNHADYLAITNKKFISKTNDYASFISNSYNVNAKVIDVDDIYDEFAYGYFNPEAIKDFLKATHSYWQSPYPEYVCLIGGATYDYHGNKTKFMNIPPKYNFVPSFGASVSDNWFVTWDTTGAYVPQMNVGRIPVTSEQELSYYMNKHINYISKGFDSWNKRFIFFSGGTGDNQSQLDQLREVNNYVIDNFVSPPPVGGIQKHFYKTINPNTNFGPYTEGEFQKTINDGAVIISYLGHSGTQTWDNSITQASQLNNNVNRNPLITDFGCSTARFAEPDVTSFSQLFVTSNEGEAIAYIGNSSLGFLSSSLLAPKLFYEKVLKDSIYTISEALKQAKLTMLQTYGSSGVYQLFALTNTLIGDPIARLPIPNKANLSISAADIHLKSANPSDLTESLSIFIKFYNYGKVTSDSFTIVIKDAVNDSSNFSLSLKKTLPKFSDSLVISIPIRKKPGEHVLTIQLDAENSIDELSEMDNFVTVKYLVVGSTIKTSLLNSVENGLGNTLRLFNPSSKQLSDSLEMEFATNENFKNSRTLFKTLDTLITSLSIADFENNKRYWARAKIVGNTPFGSFFSFIKTKESKYLLSDSLSFSRTTLANLKYQKTGIEFDSSIVAFSALSAGFYDGNSALIQKNGNSYIPENTLRGHHICLFDDSSFAFKGYRHFDLLGGGATEINNYINFLNTLSDKFTVIIAVSNEGSVSSPILKNLIKNFGSKFIDSLTFGGSWAIIGKKGAFPGSVPEAYSQPFKGKVQIDTTFYLPNKNGSLLSSEIGPVGRWDSLSVNQLVSNELISSYRPLGIRDNGIVDTLNFLSLNNNAANLSFIDAKVYPKIKILSNFKTDSDSISPNLSSLSVKFHMLPELVTNYQVVSVSKDSLIQGDSTKLKFYVYNVGESQADSFKVKVDLVKPDNSQRILMDSLVVKLDSMSRKYFEYNYLSNQYDNYGNMKFKISIDSEGKVRELYKDNNIYEIPFIVKRDTTKTSVSSASVNVTFDGVSISDGDFISPSPNIQMTLTYPVWFSVSDTSAVQFFLDEEKVSYSQLDINSDTIKRKIIFRYLPTLNDGEHTFRVFGKNIIGNLENGPGYEKTFQVSNDLKLIDVYNYPNPFKDKTDFTFILTQFPDELKIKIYTVAGRLIREIDGRQYPLRINFNRINWDGKDQDGSTVANGVYLYKVIVKKDGKTENVTQKLAIVR
ncbi:MAG: C25 family cysteine peptidase [Ignavibacteriales bacterium]|nr:C25 family cysteine peptidase [Ignavibacteriales bacterium]